ncbi:hypothetical protein [Paenibacillus xylanilyticus]|uniref:hypothetical protein n=1 Tax=Paenibacillus xylanilyticus TaxID=248903 RepID=UPI00399F34C9
MAVQLHEEHVEKIYLAWLQHKQTRVIGFCSSIRQADYLAAYFRGQGGEGPQSAFADIGDVPRGSNSAA